MEIRELLENAEKGTLVIKVAGSWRATDFITFFDSVQTIYNQALNLLLYAEKIRKPLRNGALKNYSQSLPPIEIISVSYASPGNIVIRGNGKGISALLDFFRDLLVGKDLLRKERAAKLNRMLEDNRHNKAMHKQQEDMAFLKELLPAVVEAQAKTLHVAGFAYEDSEEFISKLRQPADTIRRLIKAGNVTDAHQ
jgi:hypothetical protein